MRTSAQAIFLSYATQDAAAARRICEALRAAGVEVWFDQSELVGGDAWNREIRRQIKECALFAPVISANTQSRREGYFRIEWKLAALRTHTIADGTPFLLPIVIDDTRDADALVPEEFRAVQGTRLPQGETTPAFCARVKTLLAPQMEPGRPRPGERSEGAASPTHPKAGQRVPPPAWIAAPAIVSAAVIWFAQRKNETPSPSNASAGTRPPATQTAPAPLSEVRKRLVQARKLLDEGDDTNRENYAVGEELLRRAADLDRTDGEVWAAGSQLSADRFRYGLDRTHARREAMRSQTERASRLAPDSVEVPPNTRSRAQRSKGC